MKFCLTWLPPIAKEIQQLFDMGVWTPVDCTADMKVIGAKYVFSVKHALDGLVIAPMSWYVAKGFRQRLGVDFYKNFSPMALLSSLRLLLALAKSNNWLIHSFDVLVAYLHSPINKTVYVEPPVHVRPKLSRKVMLLKKSLYGTKQAA